MSPLKYTDFEFYDIQPIYFIVTKKHHKQSSQPGFSSDEESQTERPIKTKPIVIKEESPKLIENDVQLPIVEVSIVEKSINEVEQSIEEVEKSIETPKLIVVKPEQLEVKFEKEERPIEKQVIPQAVEEPVIVKESKPKIVKPVSP